jgi:hypothetical protein
MQTVGDTRKQMATCYCDFKNGVSVAERERERGNAHEKFFFQA